MLRILTVFLTLSFSFTALAQTGTLKGKVTDTDMHEEMIGVNVSVKGTTQGTVTDIDGNYQLKLDPGVYTITYSYLSYQTQEKKISIKTGQTLVQDIVMGEEVSVLDMTVVTGSKFEKKLGEETVSLDVIKPQALESQNITSADDALKRSSGVSVVDGQANIRGGSGWSYGAGSRVLLLQDDIPILQADAGFPSWKGVPVENIGQIEIIKGAASALYGSSAMNGIINLRTAYPTNEPYTKFSAWVKVYDNPPSETDMDGNFYSGKSKEWWKYDNIIVGGDTLDMTGQSRPIETGFSFSHRQKLGAKKKYDFVVGAFYTNNTGIQFENSEKRGRINMMNRYRVNDKLAVGVNMTLQTSNSGNFFLWNGAFGVNKYLPNGLTGRGTQSRGMKLNVDPFLTYQDDKGNKHKVQGRFYDVQNFNTNNQSNFSELYYGEYQYQKNISKTNTVITTGIAGSYNQVSAVLYGDKKYTGYNVAPYVQLDQKFWNKLNVTLGGRVEIFKISETATETKPVFRAGVNYQPAEYTFLRASVGQGYRFPTVAEKFIATKLSDALGIIGNNNLKSETGLSAELGIKQGIKLGGFTAFWDVAGFYNAYQNMMEFGAANPLDAQAAGVTMAFQSRNIGDTRILGVETTLMGEGKFLGFPTTASIGYTFIDPKFKEFDPDFDVTGSYVSYNVLKYRYRHTFTGSWDVDLKGVELGVTAIYMSAFENFDALFGSSLLPGIDTELYLESRLKKGKTLDDYKNGPGALKGNFLLHGRIAYKFNDQVKVSFNVDNILNKEYSLRPGLTEGWRNYGVRLDFTL
ncbi:MAG: TonB-dependent receptor [Chitinophagales bacterium]|nr:TonB-dependent receptor [Chitinophagales bacterium]